MTDQNSLKIAIAIALFRLKNLHPQTSFSSESDAMRWKKKAKERKLEILKLREEVRLLEDGRGSEVLPEIASCRCHFFDECGDLKMSRGNESGGHWINEVLRRRFIRLVRWKGRKKNVDNGLVRRRFFSEFDEENEIERLSTSIDFLVEFADGISLKGRSDSYFSAIFHQAVDFILASLKNLLSSRKDTELLEDIVNGLILRLARRMCTNIECDGRFKQFLQLLEPRFSSKIFKDRSLIQMPSAPFSFLIDPSLGTGNLQRRLRIDMTPTL